MQCKHYEKCWSEFSAEQLQYEQKTQKSRDFSNSEKEQK